MEHLPSYSENTFLTEKQIRKPKIEIYHLDSIARQIHRSISLYHYSK
jgi:hypothetical protein